MPQTGLKTFVYSFSVSLLTMFVANGVYWHEKDTSSRNIIIPDRNITLFLNSNQGNPSSRPMPVKKIALTVLAEKKNAAPQLEKPAAASLEPEIIMADSSDMLEIPLEIAAIEPLQTQPQPQKVVVHFAPPTPQAEPIAKITRDEPEKKRLAPVDKPRRSEQFMGETVATPQVVAAHDKLVEVSEAVIHVPAKPQNIVPVAPTIPPQVIEPQKEEILVAQDEAPTAIPLQRTRDVWAGHNETIKIADHHNLNQVALAGKNVPIKSMTETAQADEIMQNQAEPNEENWEKMADKVKSGNPWVVAKGAVSPRNAMVAQEKYYQSDERKVQEALNNNENRGQGIQVASGTVKNLLIPIPEDILNDENLTPQLVSSKKPDEVRKEIEVEQHLKEAVRLNKTQTSNDKAIMEATNTAAAEQTFDEMPPVEKKKNILNSLSSIFSSSTDVKKATVSGNTTSGGMFADMKRKLKKSNQVKIMPTEMRLSFQPNRAEISGQTLRWIQAFASKAAEDNATAIEIRIDGTSAMELQQKRLNLLHNILTNKGVEYSKINTVFTQREPNSFIIRTVRLNNLNTGSNGNMNKASSGYYLQW